MIAFLVIAAIGGVAGGLFVWVAFVKIRLNIHVTVTHEDGKGGTEGTDKTDRTHGTN